MNINIAYSDTVIDDMIFVKYPYGGMQCIMMLPMGKLSVRKGGHGLFTDTERPYEVWFPGDDSPTGYQTADDIFRWINEHKK